jgi:hypothetical protein
MASWSNGRGGGGEGRAVKPCRGRRNSQGRAGHWALGDVGTGQDGRRRFLTSENDVGETGIGVIPGRKWIVDLVEGSWRFDGWKGRLRGHVRN